MKILEFRIEERGCRRSPAYATIKKQLRDNRRNAQFPREPIRCFSVGTRNHPFFSTIGPGGRADHP
jgi:hypothetical protein